MLHDSDPQPAGLHYRSKHTDREVCWALYGHTQVTFAEITTLSPGLPEHRSAVLEVATLWRLPLQDEWLTVQRRESARHPFPA